MRNVITSIIALAFIGGACTASAQTTIGLGQTVNGSLAATDRQADDQSYVDCYTLNAPAGTTVSITLRSTSFDTFLLTGPSCQGTVDADVIDDNGGGGTDAMIETTIGNHPLVIRANSKAARTTGNYSLSVTARVPDDIDRRLGGVIGQMASQGIKLRRLNSRRTELANFTEEDWVVNLEGSGPFLIVGYCDENCTGFDLSVFGDPGGFIDMDSDPDTMPMVNVRSPGRYKIGIMMPKCEATTCKAGVAAFGVE